MTPATRFYVVAQGSVEVLDHDRLVRTMGVGEGFGEIALLGDTRRTMTVRAVDRVELYGLRRGVFVPAITSMSEASAAAEAARGSYLEHNPGAAADDPDGSGAPRTT